MADVLPAPRRRAPFSYRVVAVGMLVLGAAIAAVAVALYVRFIRYERVALRHVPEGAFLAVRIDVEQAVLYAPVRKHLLPLIVGPSSTPARAEQSWARLEMNTGLRRGDLREIVLAVGPGRRDWTLVLGGIFHDDGTVTRLGEALEEHGFVASADGLVLVQRGTGMTVGRGPDGPVLLASSEGLLRAALPPRAGEPSLPVPRGPAAFVVQGAGLVDVSRMPSLRETLEPALARISGAVAYADRINLTLFFAPDPVAPRTAARVLDRLRTLGRDGPASSFLRSGAERATIAAADGASAALQLGWEREELDGAFAALAAAIRNVFRAFPGPPVLTRP